MDKKTQDLNWRCLPKEARDRIKIAYKSDYVSDRGYLPTRGMEVLQNVFGFHNLTSDTEPAELLFVDSKDVKWRYARNNEVLARDPKNELSLSIKALLDSLFGDKCLPDKECPKNDTESVQNLGHSEQPSVQGEPKYKYSLGQEVILHFHGGEKGTISERLPPQDGNVWNCYKVKGMPHHIWRENELDPYVEPKFKVGDKVTVIDNIRAIYPDPMTIKGVSLAEDGKYLYNVIEYGIKFHEDNLEP